MKMTLPLPVGVPMAGARPPTVALKEAGWPKIDGRQWNQDGGGAWGHRLGQAAVTCAEVEVTA